MRQFLLAALVLGLGAAAFDGSALAQPSPSAPATPLRPAPAAQGVVVAFSGKTLSVKSASGVTATYVVADDARFLRLRRIDASAIKPGSFVATANVSQPDGSGVSKEFRVFAPALKGLGEGHGPMAGEAPGTMMTNGTVTAEVVSTPRGREMDVTYHGGGGQGVRHVVLPPSVAIREMSLVDRAEIKPGVAVEVRAGLSADGVLIARAILVGENGQPPAA